MGYYDGNTVTALWNYAQRFAMSDNFHSTEIGTTVMGHINLISGQTHQDGVANIPNKIANGSIIGNVEAAFDDCSKGTLIKMNGRNVGDLLNARDVTWGWFYAEFAPISTIDGKACCGKDYNNHYDPFQFTNRPRIRTICRHGTPEPSA
ncbi:MAG TPA: alkaline phosphatase family protein, partial [Beijerinckiaceae bacterium]|nr:alkaline phosphatase family protein [Beijerinckiaceae bacterium]